jgi:hypothetical protein
VRPVAFALCAACAAAFASTPANAAEVFGGLTVHDVDTFLTRSGVEEGMDVQLGWRGGGIGGSPIQPYVFGSVHTKGQTHFAVAGISAKFGDAIFIRPGLGVAIHTGSADNFQDPTNDEVEFGSRVLFAPELGIGARVAPRTTVEASWVHFSHGQLFGQQNPGMDNIGVRVSFELP